MTTKLSLALLSLTICLIPTQHLPAQWFADLPQIARESIIWSADVEEGDLDDWEFYDFEFAGGGVFNSGGDDVGIDASLGIAHSGLYSARSTISNAYRAQNGSRAVRLMRWTDRPWDDGGYYFPKEAYYSTWMYFPKVYNPNKYEPWDPGDGGWWNVFQFKANDANGESQPIWTLDVDHNDQNETMSFYLYSKENAPSSYGQVNPVRIPVAQWVHVEAYYRVSAMGRGRITIWQDGVQILDVDNVKTALSTNEENAIWGIGNYTDHIMGDDTDGSATVYFDDAAVSYRRLSAFLQPRRLPR